MLISQETKQTSKSKNSNLIKPPPKDLEDDSYNISSEKISEIQVITNSLVGVGQMNRMGVVSVWVNVTYWRSVNNIL